MLKKKLKYEIIIKWVIDEEKSKNKNYIIE